MFSKFTKLVTIFLFGILVFENAMSGTLTLGIWKNGLTEKYLGDVIKKRSTQTGSDVTIVEKNGAAQAVADGDSTIDIISLTAREVELGCGAGILEEISLSSIESVDDFHGGSLLDCGIPVTMGSIAIVFPAGLERSPSGVADFFDIDKIPGKRGLINRPDMAFRMALLADGVAPAQAHRLLSTESGINRALSKLEAIANETVLLDPRFGRMRDMLDNDFTMTTMWTNMYINHLQSSGSFRAITEPGLSEYWYLAIPRSSDDIQLALEFIAAATSPQNMEDFARNKDISNLFPRVSLSPPVVVGNSIYACPSDTCPCTGGGCDRDCCSSSSISPGSLRIEGSEWLASERKMGFIFEAWGER